LVHIQPFSKITTDLDSLYHGLSDGKSGGKKMSGSCQSRGRVSMLHFLLNRTSKNSKNITATCDQTCKQCDRPCTECDRPCTYEFRDKHRTAGRKTREGSPSQNREGVSSQNPGITSQVPSKHVRCCCGKKILTRGRSKKNKEREGRGRSFT